MENVKVSVIMPSLNVADYIGECIESVINQTLKNIEIIFVDAGSTDGTLEILNEYAKEDSRIKIINSDKKSYGYQMNIGIANATGEYIGIVETDDFVDVEMFEELYKIATENELEFIKSDFYRFVVSDNGIYDKRLFKLITNSEQLSLYNQVISPAEHLETFNFVMNTWSGIYKKEFLEENSIKHNESPGASFQDNGFWFQTFIYAKRAMFYDKPFYMNRRDNPNSSVYSKEKVYSFCHEYEYIKNVMLKNEEIYQHFKYVYSKAKYNNYFFNLNRIGKEYIMEFLLTMSREINESIENEEISRDYFPSYKWKELMEIAEYPQGYYKRVIEENFLIEEKMKKYDSIIIYGAGAIGKRTLSMLRAKSRGEKIKSFAVTSKENNLKEIDGIAVKEIDELMEYTEKAAIIVAVSAKYREEINALLRDKGFKNIYFTPTLEFI